MSRYTDIDALLTSLGEGATVEQVEYALRDHITREVLAVLADRAAAAGGGSASFPEEWEGPTSTSSRVPYLTGPFTATFATPSIGTDGALLTTLAEGTIVLNWLVFVNVTWENSGGLYLFVGDPNVSPATLWGQITPTVGDRTAYFGPDAGLASTAQGFKIGLAPYADGRIYAQCSNTVSAGSMSLYLLVVAP